MKFIRFYISPDRNGRSNKGCLNDKLFNHSFECSLDFHAAFLLKFENIIEGSGPRSAGQKLQVFAFL